MYLAGVSVLVEQMCGMYKKSAHIEDQNMGAGGCMVFFAFTPL
jgi:hypothetical protein